MSLQCWIMCSPRTGSSLLCEFLNNSGVFPAYKHHGLKENIGPLQKNLAFNEWLRLFSNPKDFEANPPSTLKAIFHQYIEVFGSVPNNKRYGPGLYAEHHNIKLVKNVLKKYNNNYITSILPKIKFIHLKRSDTISHALSLYFSRLTKKYHMYSQKDLNDYLSKKIDYNPQVLKQCYLDSLQYKKNWDNFFTNKENVIEIDYKDITNEPEPTLNKLFDFLNLKVNVKETIKMALESNKRIYKMTRLDVDFYKKKLKSIIKAVL